VLVVDAFLANDELALAELRISYMAQSPHISDVYICESPITFSGKAKPLHFANNLNRFLDIQPRTKVVTIEPPQELIHSHDAWAIEEYVRMEFLRQVTAVAGNRAIIFADLDEIPSLAQIEACSNLEETFTYLHLPTPLYFRKANWRVAGPIWDKAVVVNSNIHELDTNYRYARSEYLQTTPFDTGVHLSFLNIGAQELAKKYSAFSHQEMNKPAFSSQTFLEFSNKYRISHIGAATSQGFGLLQIVQPDSLPPILSDFRKQKPELFDFSQCSEPLYKRFLASCVVTSVIAEALPKESIIDFDLRPWNHLRYWKLAIGPVRLWVIRLLVRARNVLISGG
jgi:Glycosyltransferase family 17